MNHVASVRQVALSLKPRHSISSSPVLAHKDDVWKCFASRQRCHSTNRDNVIHRLSRSWIPTAAHSKGSADIEDSHSLLVRGGFLRQTHAGIFHLLPLGERVQSKIESVIDYHMESIGASKVSMSSISSEALWQQSGRLQGKDSELFHFQDRKDMKLLLSPTHEEEITAIVASSVNSYKDLPLRLYQISRKYRDEQRPRQGLLRGREFLMKDLYTFDTTQESSRATYDEVRSAYDRIFKQLGVPFLTAAADSGSMGGKISHEYHYPSAGGEDSIIQCRNCKDTRNEEVAVNHVTNVRPDPVDDAEQVTKWQTITKDRKTLVQVWFPKAFSNPTSSGTNTINAFAVKAALPELELDTGIEDPQQLLRNDDTMDRLVLLDPRISSHLADISNARVIVAKSGNSPILLTNTQSGDLCTQCNEGQIDIIPAIEVGHTFNLGTRYSKPFKLQVRAKTNRLVDVQMGCHGIGVSRLIAAIASVKADERGLNWPTVIAPFSVVVIPTKGKDEHSMDAASSVHTAISEGWNGDSKFMPDIAVDDRDKPFGWKLRDAELIGYPIVIIVGESYEKNGTVELQCRQLGLKEKEVLLDASTLQDLFSALETKGAAHMQS